MKKIICTPPGAAIVFFDYINKVWSYSTVPIEAGKARKAVNFMFGADVLIQVQNYVNKIEETRRLESVEEIL